SFVVPWRRGVEDVTAVELRDRQEVERRDEHAEPTGHGDRVQYDARGMTHREESYDARDDRVAQVPERLVAGPHFHAERARQRRTTEGEADPQEGQRDRESRERARGSDVDQLAAVGENGAQPNECAEGPDWERPPREEAWRGDVEQIPECQHIMSELVTQEDREQRQGEAEATAPAMRE